MNAFHAAFLPAVARAITRRGIQFHHILYWHPALANLVGRRKDAVVHFDPTDISRLFFHQDKKTWIEVPYAQTNRPVVSLWEAKAASKHLRATSKLMVSEERLFKAILTQRRIVVSARASTRQSRQANKQSTDRQRNRSLLKESIATPPTNGLDYSQPAEGYPVEIW